MIHTLHSKTDLGSAQDHYIFHPPLAASDCGGQSVEEPPEFSQLLSTHAEKFQACITIPRWREVIWATKTALTELDFLDLKLHHSTSFEAQAIRQGVATPTKTLGLVGLIKTADNFFVAGLRTGAAMGGYLCNAPAGHCAPGQPGSNVIIAGFIEEVETELGLTTSELGQISVLGYQSDPDFGRGVNTVLYAETQCTFAKIAERHRTALAVATETKDHTMSYQQIQKSIADAGLINTDAHEHELLAAIPADKASLEAMIESRQFNLSNTSAEKDVQTTPVMDIFRGSLLIYLNSPQSNQTHNSKSSG